MGKRKLEAEKRKEDENRIPAEKLSPAERNVKIRSQSSETWKLLLPFFFSSELIAAFHLRRASLRGKSLHCE